MQAVQSWNGYGKWKWKLIMGMDIGHAGYPVLDTYMDIRGKRHSHQVDQGRHRRGILWGSWGLQHIGGKIGSRLALREKLAAKPATEAFSLKTKIL